MIPEFDAKKEVLKHLCEGLPLRLKEHGMNVNEDITTEQITEAFDRFLSSEKKMTVAHRFCLGDMYNQIPKTQGKENAGLEPIFEKYGENYRTLLRTYGWVARRWWRDADRAEHKDACWSFFLLSNPKGMKPPRKKAPTELVIIERKVCDDGEHITARSKGGEGHEYRFLLKTASSASDRLILNDREWHALEDEADEFAEATN